MNDMKLEDTKNSPKTSVKVIGIGGCGINVINHMLQNKVQGVDFTAIDSDTEMLNNTLATHKITLNDANKTIQYHMDFNQIICRDTVIFMIFGLGGLTNAAVVPMLLNIAAIKAANIQCLATMPFKFEGQTKLRLSSKLCSEIEGSNIPLKLFPNEKILEEKITDLSVKESFSLVDESISQAIMDLVSRNK